ncbi:hypothetical protein ACSS6W_004925 [Trichoderma asperelloides]
MRSGSVMHVTTPLLLCNTKASTAAGLQHHTIYMRRALPNWTCLAATVEMQ